MELNKIKGLIGLADKAGCLVVGQNNIETFVDKLSLVVYKPNASKNLEKFVEKLKSKKLECVPLKDIQLLIDYSNCKIFGVSNENIAKEIKNKIK